MRKIVILPRDFWGTLLISLRTVYPRGWKKGTLIHQLLYPTGQGWPRGHSHPWPCRLPIHECRMVAGYFLPRLREIPGKGTEEIQCWPEMKFCLSESLCETSCSKKGWSYEVKGRGFWTRSRCPVQQHRCKQDPFAFIVKSEFHFTRVF